MESLERSSLTRGQFLRAAGGVGAGLVGLGPQSAWAAFRSAGARAARRGSAALYHTFRSRPDLHPPRVSIRGARHGRAEAHDGYWFLTAGTNAQAAQNGLAIMDGHGRPVWFKTLPQGWFAMDLRVQTYRGRPVLTWWQGTLSGEGEAVIMDSSYREIARVRAGNGHQIDSHEVLLTPEGTALVTCSPSTVPADLSSVGGPRRGHVWESVIQEIEIQTGKVLMEWRSLDHVPITESYMWVGGGVYDYMHANSIDLTPDGNLLVSGRHTWALYKLERRTGRVMWRLGGKRSDFDMAHGAQFAWQHDARQIDERTITVFDDGAAFFEGPQRLRTTHRQSRGLRLDVDHRARRVRLTRAFRNRPSLLAAGYGSMQTLSDGDVVVGWGNLPAATQFDAGGQVLAELTMAGIYASYRTYRQPWSGRPAQAPDVAVALDSKRHGSLVYASWNGTTHCAAWAVRAGPDPSSLRRVATKARIGFETAIPVPVTHGYVQATALDGSGRPLARSAVVRI